MIHFDQKEEDNMTVLAYHLLAFVIVVLQICALVAWWNISMKGRYQVKYIDNAKWVVLYQQGWFFKRQLIKSKHVSSLMHCLHLLQQSPRSMSAVPLKKTKYIAEQTQVVMCMPTFSIRGDSDGYWTVGCNFWHPSDFMISGSYREAIIDLFKLLNSRENVDE